MTFDDLIARAIKHVVRDERETAAVYAQLAQAWAMREQARQWERVADVLEGAANRSSTHLRDTGHINS